MESHGEENDGIYFFRHMDSARVIKILKLDPEDWLINREIQNARAAANLNGPQFYDGGLIRIDGRDRMYVEMEWMGAGVQTWEFKRSCYSPAHPSDRSRFSATDFIQKAAMLWVQAFEHGFAPLDPDFMLFENGEVRWLDSSGWRQWDSLALLRAQAKSAFHSIYQNLRIRIAVDAAAFEFKRAVETAVRESGIPEEERAVILQIVDLYRGE